MGRFVSFLVKSMEVNSSLEAHSRLACREISSFTKISSLILY